MDTTTTSTTEWIMNITDLFNWKKKRSATFTEQYINSNGLDNNIDLHVSFSNKSNIYLN